MVKNSLMKLNKSSIIAAAALLFAGVQSFKIDVSGNSFRIELTRTALADAQAKVEHLEGLEFGLASVCTFENQIKK